MNSVDQQNADYIVLSGRREGQRLQSRILEEQIQQTVAEV
jgi:hypothetical protein